MSIVFTVGRGWRVLIGEYAIKNNNLLFLSLIGMICAWWTVLINCSCKCEFVNGNTVLG